MVEQINLGATQSRTILRSTFIPPKPFEHSFTCNTGEVITAFATIDIIPHDTWSFKVSTLVRLNTSRAPTMGRAYQMWAAYYTPHQQICDKWDAIMGEVKDAAWESQTTYSVPKLIIPETSPIEFNTICDHFGWRPGIGGFELSALKLLHYLHICNEWLRDPNVEAPIRFPTDGSNITYVTGGDWTTGGTPYKINRKADYFSVSLPEPQRGEPGVISLGENAPVIGTGEALGLEALNTSGNKVYGGLITSNYTNNGLGILRMSGATGHDVGDDDYASTTLKNNATIGVSQKASQSGLTAIMEGVSAFEINALRHEAILQQIAETDARTGQRMPEQLWARYGVEVDDLILQRPRLLCSNESLIPINQVPQTSQSTETSYQGELTGFGYGTQTSDWETHSFKYHGCLMILFWIRTEHKYQQGIPREDLKFTRFDFWHPEFDGEGDQPTYTYELYATPENILNKTVFGYNERGAEYKEFPSIITGELRSEYPQSLDVWHYADYYDSEPTLSNEWMKESPENVDRTIFVDSSKAKQWKVDFALELKLTRAMRVHSIPGIERL